MPPLITANLKVRFGGNEPQYIQVSPPLWDQLTANSNGNGDGIDTLAVSVTIPSLTSKVPLATTDQCQPSLQSVIVHARPATDGHKKHAVVYMNTHLIKSVYGQDALTRLVEEEDEDDEVTDEKQEDDLNEMMPCEIKSVDLIQLDELIVGAMNEKSYEFAQKDEQGLARLFTSSPQPLIIRSGATYTFDELRFRVLMTNPVQQGFIMSTEHTKIFVVDTISSEDQEPSTASLSDSQTHFGTTSFSMLSSPITPEVIEPQEFTARILQKAWPETRLAPVPPRKQDDETRVFVDVSCLAKCGVFSGDWVLISADNVKKSRLCRIYGIDLPDDTDSMIYLPPVLYFNLDLPLPPASVSDVKVNITRLATPPPVEGPPRASALNVARIASPVSMDKSLQNAVLDALRTWFEEKDRILCKNDIIAVTLDREAARLRPHETEDESVALKTGPPTTLAYFKVTNLEDEATSESADIHPAYYGAGRRIVPSYTKMVQTGVEHSRVPVGTISQYYELAHQLPLGRPQTAAYAQLHELVSSSLHPLGRDFELSCNVLLHGPRGGGKATLVHTIAEELGVHVFEFTAYDVVSETDAKTEVHLRAKFEKAAALAPCIVLLRGIEGLAKKSAVVETGQEPLLATVLQECIKDVNATQVSTGYPVMVAATTGDIESLPSSILACFRHEITIEAPDEKTRLQILKNLTQGCPIAPDVSLSNLATQTAALLGKDLVDLVARTGVLALQRINRSIHGKQDAEDEQDGAGSSTSSSSIHATVTTSDIKAAGITLTAADFDAALNEARASYSDSIGAPKIPNVTWDDVGGLAHVKDDILDTIQLPLEHPELFGAGLKKRSGILLYGPPGTGKTLLAKAIATSCSLNFFSVKGPELLNMYIGESEANVRRVFQRARDAKPCVIFFDELDSVAPKRGEKGDSGGVMDRIVSQLLAELDGMSEGGEGSGVGDVFIVGATNRPDLLDPALLRPGRFDKLLYLGVSEDHESQLRIIQALTRKFRLHPELDLARVAERCPFHYTGADFYALCSDAMLKAMVRVADSIETKVQKLNEENRSDLPQPVTVQYFLSHLVSPEDIVVQVEEVDFVKALDELVPSVSATELAHYQRVREKFEQVKDDEEQDQEEDAIQQAQREEEKERQRIEAQIAAKIQAIEAAKAPSKSTAAPKKKDKGKGKARA
ncbi:P-loop containing nucleoside triphosphate hydrolase protein [Radiomyces spectabilis]|uniref:P-loop containing nucleoside triphosphate hydrolase protein n=1 Tax=Radiomyces spectabilis TaxID=64574 RepID=UPI0022210ED4|nr:P-loop containing nucleoside triphosphate hydrolase protein [Radiomyces spectabilis]KAI8384516.1 P-loop containing nucleoside triphosphate hydrolase protein [Radiomyces spectabilis]